MAKNPFLDLDSAFTEEELDRSPPEIKFGGRVWKFPGSMPASVMLRMARWQADGKVRLDPATGKPEDLPIADNLALLSDLLPMEFQEEMARQGLALDDPRVERVANWLMDVYIARLAEGLTPEQREELQAAADRSGVEIPVDPTKTVGETSARSSADGASFPPIF